MYQHPDFHPLHEAFSGIGTNSVDRSIGLVPFKITRFYQNYLGNIVTISNRNGSFFELPSLHAKQNRVLDIIEEIEIEYLRFERFLQSLARIDELSHPSLKELKRMALNAYVGSSYGNCNYVLTFKYSVTIEQIRAAGGLLYHVNADCLINLASQENALPHPYSEEGVLLNMTVGSNGEAQENGFRFLMDFIDNEGVEKERFTVIANKVYRIKPFKDINRKSGIYVCSDEDMISDTIKSGTGDIRYYPINENNFLELGLFSSHEEAVARGDVEGKHKVAVRDLERQVQEMKLAALKAKEELTIKETGLKNEQLILTARLAEVAAERDEEIKKAAAYRTEVEHRLKMEKLQREDQYDALSSARKDSSESIKFIPSIIMGIGAAVVAIKAIFG